jgi:hypothetical protein
MPWLLVMLVLVATVLPPVAADLTAPAAWAEDDGDDGDDGDDDDDDDDGDDGGGSSVGASSGGSSGGGSSGGGSSGGGASGGGADGGRSGESRDSTWPGDTAPSSGSLLGALARLFGGGDRDVVQGEILAFGLSAPQLASLQAAGYGVISQERLGALGETMHRLRPPAGMTTEAALDEARRMAPGAGIDFNDLYAGSSGCAGEGCWAPSLVQVADRPAGACARGAPLAIVDTAVDARHPMLKGAAITQRRFLSPGSDPAPADHGTAVAALLVGRVAPGQGPLAPGARLLVAEAFAQRGDRVQADAAAVIRGLDWALGEGARVVGLSLAGAENQLLGRAVAAVARRANLVAAAGNQGPRSGPAYPAAFPDVLAVAAVDARKRPWRGGNRGDYIDLAAPGVAVLSAGRGGSTMQWTGTSFAVPFAMAAVLSARAETRGDPAAAAALLVRNAEDLGAPGRDEVTGHGLVRAPGPRCL